MATARKTKSSVKTNGHLKSKQGDSDLEQKEFDAFTLSQLGKALISSQDLNKLAQVTVSCAYEISNASNASILINKSVDYSDQHEFECMDSIGLDEKKIGHMKFPLHEGLLWQVLNGGEPFPIRDSHGHYHFKKQVKQLHLDALQSQIWIPLISKSGLRAVLTLGERKDHQSYDKTDIGFIAQLARQAAIAIDNAILDLERAKAVGELGKKMDDLSVLYDVSKAISFTNDLKKTLLVIMDKSRKVVHAQKGSIMLLNEKHTHLEVKVVRGIDPITERKINDGEIECTKIKIGEGVAGKVFQTEKPMVVADVKSDARFKKSAKSNVENIICLPLIADDKAIGVMNITNKTSGEKFNDDDVELLTTLAGQVAVTINNANLYHLAITDGLTQLFINRYFKQKVQEKYRKNKRPAGSRFPH